MNLAANSYHADNNIQEPSDFMKMLYNLKRDIWDSNKLTPVEL